MHGTSLSPASFAARSLRSPATSSYLPLRSLTVSGFSMPFSAMLHDSSIRSASLKTFLGCTGLGLMSSTGALRTPP